MVTLMLLGLLVALCGLLMTLYGRSAMVSCVIGPFMLVVGVYASVSALLLLIWSTQ